MPYHWRPQDDEGKVIFKPTHDNMQLKMPEDKQLLLHNGVVLGDILQQPHNQ